MKTQVYILAFFFCGILFAQDLENNIYAATERFSRQQNESSLSQLNKEISSFQEQLNTKDEHFAFINLLLNKAYYLDQINRQKAALSAYQDAWSHYQKEDIANVFEYDITAYCLIPLGILYTKTGDYTNAENIIKHYIALAENKNNSTGRVIGAINLARLYQTLGKHQSVIQIIKEGLQINPISQQNRKKLLSIRKRSELALNSNKASFNNNDVIILNPLSTAPEAQLNYEIALKNKDYKEALIQFKHARAFQSTKLLSKRTKSRLYLEEAQLHFLLNDREKALKNLELGLKLLIPSYTNIKTLPNASVLFPENTFIGIFDLLAELQADPEQAIACYKLSFHVASLLEHDITSQEGQFIALNEHRTRSEKCIRLLYHLNKGVDHSNYTARAFAFAEKNKASILKRNLDKKSLLERNPQDSLLLKEQSLLKIQEQLTNSLLRSPSSVGSSNTQDDLRLRLHDISSQLKSIQETIDLRFTRQQTTAPNLKDLHEKLKQDEAILVEYFYGKQAIYQFIISDQAASFNKIILNEKIQQQITGFITLFDRPSNINNNISKFTEAAFQLYETLQFSKVSHSKKLILIPDGILNFVPFEALLSTKTATTIYAEMPFVVKSHQLGFNSSASFYLSEPALAKTDALLGFFPVFEHTTQPLSHSVVEARNIDKEMDISLFMHELASKSNFITQASNYDILHLSTHANAGNFSRPAHIEFSDSTLYLNELYSLDLNPKLVVLSACETGVGRLQRGEGALSIARGFQYAGARNILFSLWQISDLSTSQLMHSFYKNYSRTGSAFDANYHSKLDYLKNEELKNNKKSPYYWSAFVYYGTLTQTQSFDYYYLLIFGVSLVIILLLLWLLKQRHERQSSRISTQ